MTIDNETGEKQELLSELMKAKVWFKLLLLKGINQLVLDHKDGNISRNFY